MNEIVFHIYEHFLFQDGNDQSVLVRVKSDLVLNCRGGDVITTEE